VANVLLIVRVGGTNRSPSFSAFVSKQEWEVKSEAQSQNLAVRLRQAMLVAQLWCLSRKESNKIVHGQTDCIFYCFALIFSVMAAPSVSFHARMTKKL